MVDTEKQYSNGEITVVWKPGLCKHSGRCVRELPQVFDRNKRPWVEMSGAGTPVIAAQINRCPSGALSFFTSSSVGSSSTQPSS